MFNFIRPHINDISRQVIAGLIIAGLLAGGALIPVTQPYVVAFFVLILEHWITLAVGLSLVLGAVCLEKIRRLTNSIPKLDLEMHARHSTTVQDLEARVRSMIDAEKTEREKAVETMDGLIQRNQKMIQEVGTKIDALAQVLETKINTFPSEVKSVRDEISTIRISISSVASDVYDIRRAYLFQKAKDHEAKGERGGLLCRLEVVQLDFSKQYQWRLKESLEELYSFVKRREVFATDDLSDTKNRLKEITDPGNKEIVDLVLEQIKNKLA